MLNLEINPEINLINLKVNSKINLYINLKLYPDLNPDLYLSFVLSSTICHHYRLHPPSPLMIRRSCPRLRASSATVRPSSVTRVVSRSITG